MPKTRLELIKARVDAARRESQLPSERWHPVIHARAQLYINAVRDFSYMFELVKRLQHRINELENQ